MHPVLTTSVGEPIDPIGARPLLDCAQQFPEGDFPLTAHKKVDVDLLVSFGGKAGVVPSHHDLDAWPESADQFDNATGGTALKRHDGESDDFRIEFADKPGDSFTNLALNQDQISHGHPVLRINISR